MKHKLLLFAFAFSFSLLVFNLSAQTISTIAGNGTGGYNGDLITATSSELDYPTDLTLDAKGNVYVADYTNHRIRKINAITGIITTVAGIGYQGFSGNGGQATSAELSFPIGVAFDYAGNMYISDNDNFMIRKVNYSSGIITTIAGNGTDAYSGDGGPATLAELHDAQGLASDSAGNIYFAELMSSRVRKVNVNTGIITTIAGIGSAGNSGDGGQATLANLYWPVGIALDKLNNIYIADQVNSTIRKVNAVTGIINTVAGNGASGYSGDAGLATDAELYSPFNCSIDAAGDIYIADVANNRIREVNGSTGIITTVAGNGTAAFSGDGGPAINAELSNPQSVSVDSSGSLYITDHFNQRIRKVKGVTTGISMLENRNVINIYPNPASDNLVVEAYNNMNDMHIELYNEVGQKCESYKLNNGVTSISTSGLARGLYLYRIVNEGSVLKTGKIVLQ